MSGWEDFLSKLAFRDPGKSQGNESDLRDFQAFVDLMPQGFAFHEIICDESGKPVDYRYRFVNRAFEKLTGLKGRDIIGKTVREAVPGIEDSWIARYGAVALTGVPTTIEGFASPLGRHYEAYAFSHRPGFFAVTFDDMTDRKQAEDKLRVAYAQLSSIAETSVDMIFRQALDGTVLYVSPAVEAILGYRPEEVVGRKVYDFIPLEEASRVEKAREGVLSAHPLRSEEFTVRHKDGRKLTVEITSVPAYDQGRLIGDQGILRDITARKAAEEALRRKTIELEVERQSLQAIFNSAQVGMILVDKNGIVRRTNEAAAALARKSPLDTFGQRLGEALCCIHPVREGVTCGLTSACGQCPIRQSFEHVLLSGEAITQKEFCKEFLVNGVEKKVWLEIGAALVGTLAEPSVVLSISDVTMRKQVEEAARANQKRLNDLINALPHPFFFKDADGRYTGFNQAFLDFLGLPADQVMNRTVYDVAPKQLADLYFAKDRELMESPGSQIYETRVKWHGAGLREVIFYKKTLHDEKGKLLGLVGTIVDITDRKEAEERIKDSERRLQEFLNSIPVPVYLKNTQGIYVYCNQAFVDFHGKKHADIIGRTVFEVFPHELAQQLHDRDMVAFQDGKPQVFEAGVSRVDGQWREVIVYKKVHYDTQGRIIGLIGTFIDITERKAFEETLTRREDELRCALEELQAAHDKMQQTQDKMFHSEKLAAIGLLAAGVAHEINNPLGFIGSNLTILEKHIQDLKVLTQAQMAMLDAVASGDAARISEEYRHSCEVKEKLAPDHIMRDIEDILNESREGFERIRKIVFDLKTFSRADKGEFAKVEINVILESVLRIVWNEIKYKAELHREFAELPLVEGNAQQLGQVFLNMLVNASQAMVAQGHIYVRTFVRGGDIVVEIEDTGKGMTREVLSKIFDPFFTTKDPGEGTGLGLSVSYDIIKWHGGSIGVESEPGKGTKFAITLPIQRTDGA